MILISQNKVDVEWFSDQKNCVKRVSCLNKKKQKIYECFYFSNGKLSSIATWFNGVEVGNWSIYYENGQVKELWSHYTSKTMRKFPLKLDVDTDFVSYSETKNYTSFSLTKYHNPIVGDIFTYFENGKVQSIKKYKNYIPDKTNNLQIKDGVWQFYNELGELLYEREYNNGKFVKDKFYW
jgi:antitoxin component YwqK of YwqJK toxin-antitoxin module